MIEPVLTVVASSYVKGLVPELLTRLRNKRETEPSIMVMTRAPDGTEQELSLDDVSATDLKRLLSDAEHLGERGAGEVDPGTHAAQDYRQKAIEVGAAALSVDSRAFFQQSRARINLVFKIRLTILVVLVAILIAAIVGVIIATAVERGGLALVAGIGGLADLVAAFIYKPIDKIRDTITDTQRLDLIHLSVQQQLLTCSEHDNLVSRRNCFRSVWSETLERLQILEAKG